MSDSTFTPLFVGDIHDDDSLVAGAQLVHESMPVLSESAVAEPGTGPVTVEPRPAVKPLTEFAPQTITVPALNSAATGARLIGADRHRISLFLRAAGATTDAAAIAPTPMALSTALPGAPAGTVYGGNVLFLYGGQQIDLSGYTGELWYVGQGAAAVTLTVSVITDPAALS